MSRGRCGAALALVALLGGAQAVRAADLNVRWADGRRMAPVAVERLATDSNELYASADALAEALSLERFWRPEARKLVLVVGDRRVQVTIDTRLVLDGEDEVLLHEPVLYRRGAVMLPLEFLSRVLVQHLGEGARFDRGRLELVVGRTSGDVLGLDYEPGTDATRVRVRLARDFDYRAQATSRQLVRLRIDGARIDPVALVADRPAPLVRSVRAEQSGGAAILYFELEGGAGFADRTEDGGRTIVLDLQRGADASSPPISARTPLLLQTSGGGTATADSFDVVVLDPGHGGFDRGARSGGLDEPEVTLRIATALQPILERDLGVHVVLTRQGDATLSAGSRAEIANRSGADLFVSLHCDAWFDADARGVQVLYSPILHTTAADAALANWRHGMTDFVPWNVAHVPYAERSRDFAQELAAQLQEAVGGTARGAQAADVDVLHGATMPAVVLELGFLTNAEDRRALGDPAFASRIGAALVAAISSLRNSAKEARP